MQGVRTARGWIWAALALQALGLAFDGVWHGLISPGVEPTTFGVGASRVPCGLSGPLPCLALKIPGAAATSRPRLFGRVRVGRQLSRTERVDESKRGPAHHRPSTLGHQSRLSIWKLAVRLTDGGERYGPGAGYSRLSFNMRLLVRDCPT